jgi:undecaprenyl-phosphate galactose phosphotransferase/putative colanic acid biosynthesis UDP-glucose lipid carrier transferase
MLILTASFVGGAAYHELAFGEVGSLAEYAGEGANAGLIFVLLMSSLGFYRTSILLSRGQLRAVGGGWLMAMMTLVGFLFLLKSTASHSRGALISFAILGFVILIGWRTVLALQLREALAEGQMTGCRVFLIGNELARHSPVSLLQDYGAREIGRFSLLPSDSREDLSPRDAEIIEDAIRAARAHQPSKILLAVNWSDERRRELICARLRLLPIPILLLPDRSTETLLAQPVLQMGTAAAVELQRAPLSFAELAIKRGFDLILTMLGIIVLLPVFIVSAMAVKLDTAGPVIFRQHRRGFNGRIFTIYKFRTMSVLEDGPALRQAARNDRRITRVGAFLRRTSIDELPQLFNVLHGEMSLVGPRPHAIAHDDQYSTCISDYAFRNHVKPGLTGLAQIKGLRGETARVELMERRVDHDVWYVNHWSVWLDLWIVARTFFAVVTTKNAY